MLTAAVNSRALMLCPVSKALKTGGFRAAYMDVFMAFLIPNKASKPNDHKLIY